MLPPLKSRTSGSDLTDRRTERTGRKECVMPPSCYQPVPVVVILQTGGVHDATTLLPVWTSGSDLTDWSGEAAALLHCPKSNLENIKHRNFPSHHRDSNGSLLENF